MVLDAAIAAVIAARLGARLRPTTEPTPMDARLRRDIGLPPVEIFPLAAWVGRGR